MVNNSHGVFNKALPVSLEGKFIIISRGVFYMKNIRLQKNVPCTVRDGTTLYADIYRPD
jgi:predicted acyl esterase